MPGDLKKAIENCSKYLQMIRTRPIIPFRESRTDILIELIRKLDDKINIPVPADFEQSLKIQKSLNLIARDIYPPLQPGQDSLLVIAIDNLARHPKRQQLDYNVLADFLQVLFLNSMILLKHRVENNYESLRNCGKQVDFAAGIISEKFPEFAPEIMAWADATHSFLEIELGHKQPRGHLRKAMDGGSLVLDRHEGVYAGRN